MIIDLPATFMSPAGVHFSVSGGKINAQPRSKSSLLKLFLAHGGSIFDTQIARFSLAEGKAVILLRGKCIKIKNGTNLEQVLLRDKKALEKLGCVFAQSEGDITTRYLDSMPALDVGMFKTDPFAFAA